MATARESLLILAITVFPGAMFVWALERRVGKWEFGLSDRALRFVVFSAMLHAPAFPFTAWLVTTYVTGERPAPWGIAWGTLVLYTFVPAVLGGIVGRGARSRSWWSELFTGRDPAPQAWDDLFQLRRHTGWIRLKLKSGAWIGGAWVEDDERGLRSYAAGFPHPSDLYLAETMDIDPDDGSFVLYDHGEPVRRNAGVLVRWDEAEYLEFVRG